MNKNQVIKRCLIKYNNSNQTSITSVIFRTILAAFLSSNGLLNNLLTSIIPAMIISPLGSVLLDTTIYSISKYQYKNMNKITNSINTNSILDMIFLLIICILLTILIGVIYGYIYITYQKKELPTEEMKKAQDNKHIIETIIIVFLCSITLPMAYKRKEISTLISIGIATALLPPIVNFGITIGTYIAKPEYYENYMEKKNIKSIINYSFKYSGIIFLINSISLIVASYLYINYECKNISKDIDIF